MKKTKLNIAYIKASWHAQIVDQTLIGFEDEMKSSNIDAHIETYAVPGAFEMPLLAKKLGETGKFDYIIAAALVVDGGIYRHEFVAQAVVTGLMDAQMATGVPTLSVSLTPHHFHENNEHTEFFTKHFVKKGREAAKAVLQLNEIEI